MWLLHLLTFLTPSQAYMHEYMDNRNFSTENWTTCEQFLEGTHFEVASVIDIDWQIFYYWSPHPERSYHVRFSSPSPTLVDRFRLELNKHLMPLVNWTLADLFMETSIDLSGLYIRTEMSGKFRFIPSLSFQFQGTPMLEIGLKVVDGYLSMMNCKQQVAYGLAPVQNMPKPNNIVEVAALFNIRNPLGRSYLIKNKHDPPPGILQPEDVDENDDDDWNLNANTVNMIF